MTPTIGMSTGMLQVFPQPEECYDNIIPRGPNLDCFIRRFNPKNGDIINYGALVPEELSSVTDMLYQTDDQRVLDAINYTSYMDQSAANSLIYIVVEVMNSLTGLLEQQTGSGCLITPRHVFTARHVFDLRPGHAIQTIKVYWKADLSNAYQAQLMDLSVIPSASPDQRLFKVGNTGEPWGRVLDFAVLELVQDIQVHQKDLMFVPSETSWYESSVLCGLGYPGAPSVSPDRCFPSMFTRFLDSWDTLRKQLVLRVYFRSALFNFDSPLAFFGAASHRPLTETACYALSSMSMTFGCSGGPVIANYRPNELVGLIIGAFEGSERTIFLDVQTPFIKAAYKYCHDLMNRCCLENRQLPARE